MNKNRINKMERIPLKKGDELYLKLRDARGETYSQKAVVEAFIGEGATCLTYTVSLYKDGLNASRMIMKEFYPETGNSEGVKPLRKEVSSGQKEEDGIQIQRVGKELRISVQPEAAEEYVKEKIRFEEAYAMQNRLSGSEAMEIMVKPYQIASYGDSQYILSDIHKGEVVNVAEMKDFSKKIWFIYRLAEAVQLLHEQGYLYMDINPKNVLWIESQQIVKLFDVDSIIPYKNLEEVHEVRVTRPYVAPEIRELEGGWFEVTKKEFLRPSWDIYCLGLLMFEVVFGRFPTEKDLETGCGEDGELETICSQNDYDEETCVLLKKILKRALSKKFRTRYKTAEEMCRAVNELKKRVDAKAFISKKEFAKANEVMKAYYMLDRWPLYRFTKKHENHLDIAIVGRHPMREEFVKAVYSCAHMRERITRIRIYAPDAKKFWEELEKKNPLLGRTIRLFLNGTCLRSEADEEICSNPIAEIYLYDDRSKGLKSNYILLLEESGAYQNTAKWVREQLGSEERKLVGYLDYGCSCLNQKNHPEHTFVPITLRSKCSYYDEKLLETELLQYALNVHAFYYRNNHRRAAWEELKEDFESSVYNIESSMRSALTIRYTLASIELDIVDETSKKSIAEQFRKKVLSESAKAQRMFEELASLEHLSWSAYLIMNGWNVPTREQIEAYAFVGRNDFKDKEHLLHPCLVECRPGRGLEHWTQAEWEIALESNVKASQLDALDKMSVLLHQIAREKAKKAAKKIEAQMEHLGELAWQYHLPELQNGFQWLNQAKDRILAGEAASDAKWRQAEHNFFSILEKYRISNPQFHDCIGSVRQEMRVVHEYYAYHEYKTSDGAIIRGIPYILTGDKVRRVIKPYIRGDKANWKNILTSLYLEPEELVFVNDFVKTGEGVKKLPLLEEYQDFFAGRGMKTKISVQSMKDLESEKGQNVWDVTGLNQTQIKKLQSFLRQKNMITDAVVRFQSGEIIGLGNDTPNPFSKRIHFQVEELFKLFGEEVSLSGREETALLLSENYKNIWSARKKIANDVWAKLTDTLLQAENQKQCELPYQKGIENTYQTETVNGKALRLTDIHRLLEKCREEGLITGYFCPGEEDELPVVINTDSRQTFDMLHTLIQRADEEPLRHKYQINKQEETYKIIDRSLYVRLEQVSGAEKEALLTLEMCGKGKEFYRQQVSLQNLKIDGDEISFKYASEAVRQCLQSAEAILDIALYHECRLQGDYDDIRILDNHQICCSKNAVMNCLTAGIVEDGGQKFLQVECQKDFFSLIQKKEKKWMRYAIV